MNIVYLNGEYLPIEQARISVLDRGFLFGDGVYEVIPVFKGRLFRMKEHMQRLQRSLDGIDLKMKIDLSAWQKIFDRLIEEQGGGDQSIYLQITRGAGAQRDHSYSQNLTPTIFCMTTPYTSKTVEQLKEGLHAITLPDTRWDLCHIKAITLLANLLSYQYALNKDVQEAILIRDGHAIEATSSNFFIVKNEVIMTSPITPYMLGGITRDLVIELAHKHKMKVEEIFISESALREADEIWLTSSKKEIAPVLSLDGKVISKGVAGPVWQQMIKHYSEFKKHIQSGHG